MTDYQVAIPSHARAGKNGLNKRALRALADAGINPHRVRVFVAADELDTYRRLTDPGLCAEVVEGRPGLNAQRMAIDQFYGDGASVVQVDDDVSKVVQRQNERKLVPVADLHGEIVNAFHAAHAIGARLWGVYPVPNAGWMKHRVAAGLLFCWGSLFGHVVDTSMLIHCSQKEDYERTLRYWAADGTVARVEWLSVRTRMYAPGGMQAPDQPDRSEANEASVAWLMANFPGHVRVAKRVGKCGTEIRLVA